MQNYAGRADVDDEIAAELAGAGIKVERLPEIMRTRHPEMRTVVVGTLGPWSFQRAWYYWVAQGPGLPPEYADPLHETHGQEVRVDGHCGCPSPREWYKGFGVPLYHVDSQSGLNALAAAIRRCMADAGKTADDPLTVGGR